MRCEMYRRSYSEDKYHLSLGAPASAFTPEKILLSGVWLYEFRDADLKSDKAINCSIGPHCVHQRHSQSAQQASINIARWRWASISCRGARIVFHLGEVLLQSQVSDVLGPSRAIADGISAASKDEISWIENLRSVMGARVRLKVGVEKLARRSVLDKEMASHTRVGTIQVVWFPLFWGFL